MGRPSLALFQLHVSGCSVCRAHPKAPCAIGFKLFNENAYVIARTFDPRRAKA